MLVDVNDPKIAAGLAFIASFLLSIGVLYLTKPTWIQKVDERTKKIVISWILVNSYSITFALVVAIGILLYMSKQRGAISEKTTKFNFISPAIAAAYKI